MKAWRAFGGYAEYVAAPASMAFEMPSDMPEAEAAAIFMPFHLAWLALYERARLQAGETLLVHAGAGGAGSAALQLGVHAGARVFATAGSPEKTKDSCRDPCCSGTSRSSACATRTSMTRWSSSA